MARRMNMALYLGQLKIRYIQANKKSKSIILNEFCETSGSVRYKKS